ncbi:MAG: ribonuclease P protein component [Bacillaceae bacterium]|nr:ribonuclease P protein component [Bacillaceae bacterium]
MNKKYRLRKNEDFQKVFKQGQSFANRQFVIYRLDHQDEQESFRVGISVSKKLGNAVVRNRIKRLIREAVRLKESEVSSHVDFVIIARKPVVDLDFHQLSNSLYHCMRKAKLLKRGSDQKKGFRND